MRHNFMFILFPNLFPKLFQPSLQAGVLRDPALGSLNLRPPDPIKSPVF